MNPNPKIWNPHAAQSSTEEAVSAAVLEMLVLGSGTPHALHKAKKYTQQAPRATLAQHFAQYCKVAVIQTSTVYYEYI